MQSQDVASEADAAGTAADNEDTITLSTGVVLELQNAPPIAMATAMDQANKEEPQVPVVFIEGKQRSEPNPNDPEYITAHQRWEASVGIRALRALIPTGTVLKVKPDNVIGPEDEDYPDLMDSMGLEPGKGKFTRYVNWVLHIACGGTGDVRILTEGLMRRAGVREEDVVEAASTFPDNPSGSADSAPSS